MPRLKVYDTGLQYVADKWYHGIKMRITTGGNTDLNIDDTTSGFNLTATTDKTVIKMGTSGSSRLRIPVGTDMYG